MEKYGKSQRHPILQPWALEHRESKAQNWVEILSEWSFIITRKFITEFVGVK